MNKGFLNIAVLLTCYNRRDTTIRCLQNLFLQSGKDEKFYIEVFLVDDASSDNTAEAVKSLFPEVNVIRGSGNLFWSKGMHLAWKTAAQERDFDFYLWLNDDTYIFPNAILVMLEGYSKSGENAIISGSTKSEITGQLTYGGKSKDGKRLEPDGNLKPCIFLNGNFVLVSQNIYKKIGMIDSIFPHSIGDHDYGLRAMKKGFQVLIAPSYIGYCERHESLPKWCLSKVPLKDRIKSLYSPKGSSHPYYFFIYERRHFGLLRATKHFFSIHLRLLLPALWR